MCRPIATYLRMSAMRIIRLPLRANVPAQRTRQMHSPPRGMKRRRCGLLPNCLGHLLLIIMRIRLVYHASRVIHQPQVSVESTNAKHPKFWRRLTFSE